MIRLALPAVLIALTACGSTAPPPPPMTPNPPESVGTPATPVATTVKADAAHAPPVAPSMPAELLVRPQVNAIGSLLFLGASSRIDGIAVTFARSATKQVGRITTGTFDFKLVKGGKKVDVHLQTQRDKFQAEVVAHDALFVFEQRSADVFTVMLAAAVAPAQLDEAACLGLIDQAGKRAGITDTSSAGLVSELGILQVRRDRWTAHCGRYTRRVWFSPRGEAADGATP